ncbi:pyrroloquinoline quinone biosynthesis peptide chaperone PqqD [Methylobacterium frigidaeris]|uniref:Bifunctional coenzyme PQQ synthesis protein C/D n=1 Tax=Methylobacterium frigidaeris TaxID=2038277 RepID=A0AA37HG33_9HYPH|nr:pyrroloquinoline quinone biosynthesis peptide chaperone PqqD [Methylobacterium frigidaeris]GJD65240.1 Bifunctional coenzyme PQQ synthesis protein C/D [Methylobacterium frigidaeris]
MSLTPDSVPHLPRGVRMRHDTVRNAHVLLAPERTFDLDQNAVAVLSLVDGARSIRAIAEALAQQYETESGIIEPDVITMLDGLLLKRVLETVPAP